MNLKRKDVFNDMKVIIGAGCVGLSIAYNLLEKFKSAEDIVIIDKYNIPTKRYFFKK